jgi:hypothetical protein
VRAQRLPGPVANELTEVGWPQAAPQVRALPVALSGTPQAGRASHNAKPVAAEYGWLTPLRKSNGDPTLWFFRCRCGAEIQRLLGGVRRDVRGGKTPKCGKGCAWTK